MGSIYSLVRSAQNGNDKAKQHLYKDTSNKAYYMAYVLLGDKELVQKALSNVYLTLYTEIGTLDKPKYFDIWFTKLLVQETVKIYREINPEAFLSTESEEASVKDCPTLRLDTYDDTRPHAPEEFYNPEHVKTMLTKINGICSNEQLICGVLYYFAGLSIVDIAEGLGCPVAVVKMKLAHLVGLVESGIGALVEEGLDTYGMKPMDFYTCLLDINMNQVWYISQDVSNNIMSKVLTAINRGTEEKTVEIVSSEAPYAMPDQQLMVEDWTSPDNGGDTSGNSGNEGNRNKGILSGAVQGIIVGIIAGIIILAIILLVIKIKAGGKDNGSEKNIRRDTETVTSEEKTEESVDEPDIIEASEMPDNEERDDRDNKKEKDNDNQNTDSGISGSGGISGGDSGSGEHGNSGNDTSGNIGGSSQDNSTESDDGISGGSAVTY